MNIEAVLVDTPGIGLELYCRRPGCTNAPYFVLGGLACCAECLPVVSDFQRKVLQERKRTRDAAAPMVATSASQPATPSSATIADMFAVIERLSATEQPTSFKCQLASLAKFGGLLPRNTVIPLQVDETLIEWMHRPEAPAILKRMAGFGGGSTGSGGPPDKQRGL
jgi:hypothetical protein